MAKRLTDSVSVQGKLVGHAWFIIGEADAQRTVQYYKDLCSISMYKQNELYKYGEK